MCGPGCGCGTAAGAPVACTLPAGAMRERLGEFEALFAASLRKVERGPLVLRLELDAESEARARALFAAEAECCAFLDFAVTGGRAEGLVVTVTAPAEAGAALDGLQELAERRSDAAAVAGRWPR